MKYFTKIKLLISLLISLSSGVALAGPNMNTIYVQGYLRKATGTAVTDGSYTMTFTIRSGATNFWTKSMSVSVSGGFFSQGLTGASSAPYGANSIDSTAFSGAAAGALAVNVATTVDGVPVSFDVQASPVPLALVADKANTVVAGAIDSTALAANSVTAAKLAASGTLPAWDGSALTNISATNIAGTLPGGSFPATLPAASGANLTNLPAASLTGTLPAISGASLTNLDATNITAGTLAAARLPTTLSSATTFSAAGTALAVTNNATVGGTLGVTGATTLGATTAVGTTSINASGAGTTAIGGGSSTGTIDIGGGTSAAAINVGSSSAAQGVTIGGSSSTGAINIASSTGAQAVNVATGAAAKTVTIGSTNTTSATTIQAGSGKILLQSNAVTGVAFSAMGACTTASITATNAGLSTPCTGVPAAAVITCSPTTIPPTAGITWGAISTAGNVTIRVSAAPGGATTWKCMWMMP